MIAFPVVWFIVVKPHSVRGLHFVFCSFQLRLAATMLKSYSFNPLWRMNTTVSVSGNINLIPHLRAIIGRLLQKIILVRSLRSNFIDSFSFTKKRCNYAATLRKVFWRLFLSVMWSIIVSFFLFLVFFSFFLDFYGNQWLSFESTTHWFVFQRNFNGSEMELLSCRKNTISAFALAML